MSSSDSWVLFVPISLTGGSDEDVAGLESIAAPALPSLTIVQLRSK